MATATQTVSTLLTMEEYLQTSYHPDCDFVDGYLEERHMGGKKHAVLQMYLGFWFISHEAEWRVRVMSELRTRTGPTRVRLPDVCVVPIEEPIDDEVQTTPPIIAIEILSPKDRMNRVTKRLEDFLKMGVEHIWLLDPAKRVAYTFNSQGLKLIDTPNVSLPNSPIYLDLAKLFAALN